MILGMILDNIRVQEYKKFIIPVDGPNSPDEFLFVHVETIARVLNVDVEMTTCCRNKTFYEYTSHNYLSCEASTISSGKKSIVSEASVSG